MKYTQEEIYEIVRLGDLATIVSMIQDGVDVNNFMIYKKTDVLLVSIFKENLFLINQVLSLGFDCEKNKILYLHHAIRIGNLTILEVLLNHYKKNKLNINQKNNEGNSLLHIACSNYNQDNAQIIVYLYKNLHQYLNLKKNIWLIDNKNKETALHILLRRNYPLDSNIVDILVEQKMNVFNKQDNFNLDCKDIILSYANSQSWLSNESHQRLLEHIKK